MSLAFFFWVKVDKFIYPFVSYKNGNNGCLVKFLNYEFKVCIQYLNLFEFDKILHF